MNKPSGRRMARRASRGVALIEAMVAIIIFSIGVLGVVGLQSAMTKTQSASKFRGDAAYLASELIGTMWGDIGNLTQYATASCTSHARCSDWKAKVGTTLPKGDAKVEVVNGEVTITITWTTPGGDGGHEYKTSTAIRT